MLFSQLFWPLMHVFIVLFFTFTSYDHDYVITSVKVIYSGCYLINCWIGAQHYTIP